MKNLIFLLAIMFSMIVVAAPSQLEAKSSIEMSIDVDVGEQSTLVYEIDSPEVLNVTLVPFAANSWGLIYSQNTRAVRTTEMVTDIYSVNRKYTYYSRHVLTLGDLFIAKSKPMMSLYRGKPTIRADTNNIKVS